MSRLSNWANVNPNSMYLLLAYVTLFGYLPCAVSAETTRVTTYEYDSNTGYLKASITNPADPNTNLRSAYTRDIWGNMLATQFTSTANGVRAIPIISRPAVEVIYDEYGVSENGRYNALGQLTQLEANREGARTSQVDPDGRVTYFTYDDFGRRTNVVTTGDGFHTARTYSACDISVCTLGSASYFVRERVLNSSEADARPPITTYFDAFDRPLRTETVGFDGKTVICEDTEYDAHGRVSRKSRPYFVGGTIKWTEFVYDVLDRVVDVTNPDGSNVHTSYSGLSTTVTNSLGQSRSTTVDSAGRVIRVVDAAGGVLTYEYDPIGNLVKTVDPKGNTVTMSYDAAGNKVAMSDPDQGAMTYVYDALGRLKQQVNAKNQMVTFEYDLIGRVVKRTEPDLVTQWTYDSCRVGRICKVAADSGYWKQWQYDTSSGRVTGVGEGIDTNYTTYTQYDWVGRPVMRTYPSGFMATYAYTPLGFLKEIKDYAADTLIWRADAMDAEGHLSKQSYGNGISTTQAFDPNSGRTLAIQAGTNNTVQNLSFTYDTRGNLITRSDANQSLSESFVYDSLNRLTSNTVNSNSAGQVIQTYAYDSIGNITNRSGVGAYNYGAVNVRPHAVSTISRDGGGIRQYTYDAVGNLTQEVERDVANNVIAAKGRTVSWTSFNMPLTISTPNDNLTYVYGSDHQRIKEISNRLTTIYLHPDNAGGLLYEKDVNSTGVVEHRHFITAPGVGVVALVKQDGNGNRTTLYMHRDHLGSVTAVTNSSGAVVERMAYEPFGKRRALGGALDPNNQIAGITTNRGYTDHEELDSVGLIHMNGRVYDPAVGRFMSADPTNANPLNLQSFNKYSYVHNNPLVSIDPTGFVVTANGGGCSSWLDCAWESLVGIFAGGSGDGGSVSAGSTSGAVAERPGGIEQPIATVEVVGKRPPAYSCQSDGSCFGTGSDFGPGGRYEVNIMGDPVNPNYPGVGVATVTAAVTVGAAGAIVAPELVVLVRAGAATGKFGKNVLREALAEAEPTSGHPNQLMTTLEDGTRVIFRKDFGEKAHAVGGPFQGAGRVDHYNIQIQSASGKTIENVHVVPDGNGGYVWWALNGVIKP